MVLAEVLGNEDLATLLYLGHELLLLELDPLQHGSQKDEAVDSKHLSAHVQLKQNLLPDAYLELLLDPQDVVGARNILLFVIEHDVVEIFEDFKSSVSIQNGLN
jgi:hypothetical protein